MLLTFVLASAAASSASVGNAQVCRLINIFGVTDPAEANMSNVMDCVDESYNFTTEDIAAFMVLNLLDVTEGDEVSLEVYRPDSTLLDTLTTPVPDNLSSVYFPFKVGIAGTNPMLGVYSVVLKYKGTPDFSLSKTFSISQPDSTCEGNGYFCCPSSMICLDKADAKYTCTSSSCCSSQASCVQQVSDELTVKTVTDCVAQGLQDCGKVIGNVYDYIPHGALSSAATLGFSFRDIDVDCYNKQDVAIASYDGSKNVWKVYESNITKLGGGYYNVNAQIDYVGYMAVVKSPKCVPTDCFIPGFHTVPFDSLVNVGNSIKLGVCQVTKSCDASPDNVCDRKCTQGLDPDCAGIPCTSFMNDCCNPEKDNICDLDCASRVDPDCADESYLGGLCYPSNAQKRGFADCDVHCTGADPLCTQGEYCNPAANSVCDPKCPKLSNGIGYLDVDCCSANNIPVSNSEGDCCDANRDDVCDPDCIPGLDPDCSRKAPTFKKLWGSAVT